MKLKTIALAGILAATACSKDSTTFTREHGDTDLSVLQPEMREGYEAFSFDTYRTMNGSQPVKEGLFYNRLEECKGFTVHRVVGSQESPSVQLALYIGDDCDSEEVRQNSTMIGAASPEQMSVAFDFSMQDNNGIEVIVWEGLEDGMCYNHYSLANSALFTQQEVYGCGAQLTNRFNAGAERFKEVLHLNDHIDHWHKENLEKGLGMQDSTIYHLFN